MAITALIQNALRGFLIGVAEVIPGVSGGTIALIVGVYQRIIDSAAALTKVVLFALRGKLHLAKSASKQVEWGMLIPLGIGMLSAILIAASILEPLLEAQPQIMRGLFFGMILISLYVPYKMAASRWGAKDYVLGLGAAVVSFALMSMPRATEFEPNLLIVFLGAAVAVCALVLPGVSGSFLLLAVGLYAPTIAAVNNRDLVYLGVFVLGAIAGLASFSTALSWLLANRRRLTLVLMTGLMLGSLRALWPWQTELGAVQQPDSWTPFASLAFGFMSVGALILWQHRLENRSSQ